ncbi:MAG: FAD-binding oxidoreductase [Flammeovirgaceae bacterium]
MDTLADIQQDFIDILGEQYVAWADDSLSAYYATDQTGNFSGSPQWILFPKNTEEVSQIVKICHEQHIKVLVRGGGTNVTGATVPFSSCVILSTKRLNKIIEINPIDRLIIAEAGVITHDLQEAVQAYGLAFPQNISSSQNSFIGGNIAVSSGSPRSLKYGTTKDYVLNLEVVLPNGDIIWTGKNVSKNATGYNLSQLFVGSEGTLGIITKVVLKLIPIPQCRCVTLIPFQDLDALFKSVNRIFLQDLTPSALEFVDHDGLPFVKQLAPGLFNYSQLAGLLWVEFDANSQEALDGEFRTFTEQILINHPDAIPSFTPSEIEKLWNLRMKLGYAIQAYSAFHDIDMVVPRSKVSHLYWGIKEIAKQFGLKSIAFAHIGNGNMHVNLLKEQLSDETWQTKLPQALQTIYELTAKLGGSISGEHGVGHIQKQYLSTSISRHELALMKQLKQLIDPHNILNQGLLFE